MSDIAIESQYSSRPIIDIASTTQKGNSLGTRFRPLILLVGRKPRRYGNLVSMRTMPGTLWNLGSFTSS